MPPRREVVDPPLAERPKRGRLRSLPTQDRGPAHLAHSRKPMAGGSPDARAMPRHVTFPREPRRSVSRAAAESAFTSSRGLYPARNIHQPNRRPHDPTEHSPAESRQTHEKGCRSPPNTRDDKSIVWNGKRRTGALRWQYGDWGRGSVFGEIWGRGRGEGVGAACWLISPVRVRVRARVSVHSPYQFRRD